MKKLYCLIILTIFNQVAVAEVQFQSKALTTYYADCDGDGWGDPAITTQATSPPATVGSGVCLGGVDPIAWSLNGSDCDDSDASISPDAFEICDGIDNNCDASIDGNDSIDQIQWCADNDMDMLGDLNNTFTSCNMPSGFVLDCTDCNDADAMIGNECLIPIFIDGFELLP